MISRFTLFVLTISLLSYTETIGQTKTDPLLKEILSGIQDSTTKSVLKNPDQFRVQIIYTQINRDKKGKPSFTNYHLNVDPELYFNPASMVKMTFAFLSLEKLQEMNKSGVKKNTRMNY